MGLFAPFTSNGSKKKKTGLIPSIKERNSQLDEIYDWQNNKMVPKEELDPKKKKKWMK